MVVGKDTEILNFATNLYATCTLFAVKKIPMPVGLFHVLAASGSNDQ
jgi:hypothetical protein